MAEARRLIPISADWVLKRIQDGKKVRLKNALIKGDLDISKLDLPTRHIERTESQKEMGLAEDVKIVQSLIKITDSIFNGYFDFRNSIFSGYAEFEGATFSEFVKFDGATFSDYAGFEGATFSRDVIFDGATFSWYAWFNGTTFSKYAGVNGATFRDYVRFDGATFSEYAGFEGATFLSSDVNFKEAAFSSNVNFEEASFSGDVRFDEATFSEYAGFKGARFEGDVLTFRRATFISPLSQEEACRKAKNVLEKNGDREEAGYHFYREMEAKRKQKESDYKYFDYEALLVCKEIDIPPRELTDLCKYLRYNILDFFFIQVIFGYGVHPFRLWSCWWVFVGLFALLYWMGSGINNSTTNQPLNFLDYLWFSITVAVTPGFAGYKPVPGFYQVVAGVEAIFGTFMWVAFITTFGKKYMK